jgi:hypothetical protein
MSGAMQSTLANGRPRKVAIAARTLVGAWVDEWTRRRCSSASQWAWVPRVSIGVDADLSIARSRWSRCGAAEIAPAASPNCWVIVAPTLSDTWSWTRWVAASAASWPTTGGRGA